MRYTTTKFNCHRNLITELQGMGGSVPPGFTDFKKPGLIKVKVHDQ